MMAKNGSFCIIYYHSNIEGKIETVSCIIYGNMGILSQREDVVIMQKVSSPTMVEIKALPWRNLPPNKLPNP